MSATLRAAERVATTPSEDGDFFEWKFERVRGPRDALVRARFTDVLRESAPRLVLLAAPPGFGKTTVLAQWREVDDRVFACLSLDSGDNDPVTFWSYIVQAIRHVAPGWAAAALSALPEPRADAVEAVVLAVLRDLEAIGEKLVLVLDDYQEITNRICHDSLNFFLERTPSNVTLVVSTRSDPPIPIGRLRALDELIELRALDLNFTEAESATLPQRDLAPEPRRPRRSARCTSAPKAGRSAFTWRRCRSLKRPIAPASSNTLAAPAVTSSTT